MGNPKIVVSPGAGHCPRAPSGPLVTLALLLALIAHGLFGAATGFSVDEAHYALYAVHLDWSYFDHPPMVGWLQWPLVALGATPGWLRMIPQVIWLLTVWQASELAHDMLAPVDPARAIAALRWTVLVLLAAPMLHVLAVALLPDVPLMLLGLLVLRTALRIAADNRLRDWLWLGVWLGLAGLTKYTAVTLVPAVLLLIVATQGGRVLRGPGPWLAALIALICIVPVLGWNAAHDWVSFRYQLGHGVGNHSWQLRRVLTFVVLQVLVYGPLATLLPWRARRLVPGARMAITTCLCIAIVPLLLLGYLAGGSNSLPHWTAYAWVALAPLAGITLACAGPLTQRIALGFWFVQAALIALLLSLVWWGGLPAALLSLLPPATAQKAAHANPVADLYGWDQAGARAVALARSEGVSRLAVQNWTLASRLAWYAQPLPVQVLQARFDQFSLWFGDQPLGAPAIVVDWSGMSYAPPQQPGAFASCRQLDSLTVRRHGMQLSYFDFFRCDHWGGQATPQRIEGQR